MNGLDEQFEIIDVKTKEYIVSETDIAPDHYIKDKYEIKQVSFSTNISKEKKDVCIELGETVQQTFEMSSQKKKKRERTGSEDPVILKVIASVSEIQSGVSANGGTVPGSDVLSANKTVVSGKKIKITQRIIGLAYKKLRVIIDDTQVNTESVVFIAVCALQISNEMLITSKTYKVELALAIIRKLIDDEVKDPVQRAMLHMLVESTIPSLIDTIHGLPSMLSKFFSCCKSQ